MKTFEISEKSQQKEGIYLLNFSHLTLIPKSIKLGIKEMPRHITFILWANKKNNLLYLVMHFNKNIKNK